MPAPVFIAGLGAISAIGNNVQENLDSLKKSIPGMVKMRHLPSVHQQSIPVAEVKKSNEELATVARLRSGISRTALLSMIAAREALTDTGMAEMSSWRTGFISANTTGGMDRTED
ncbi:MAG TPA: hypothetical protein VK618_08265, partial [Flavitalea sp.]|nr:hypothetical protein [Flavitalea sp.]